MGKKKGDFERYFATRPRALSDYWRALLFAGTAYYGEARVRTMLREVRRAKRIGGADPFKFIDALDQAIEDDWKRQPDKRRAAALAWCERREEIERIAARVIREAREGAGTDA